MYKDDLVSYSEMRSSRFLSQIKERRVGTNCQYVAKRLEEASAGLLSTPGSLARLERTKNDYFVALLSAERNHESILIAFKQLKATTNTSGLGQ